MSPLRAHSEITVLYYQHGKREVVRLSIGHHQIPDMNLHQFTRASTNPSRIVTMRESLIRGLARVECVALLELGAGFHIPKARAL